VVHLENLHDEWNAMTKRLCDEYGYCGKVPLPEKINAAGGDEEVTARNAAIVRRWPKGVAERFVERFRCDFEYFGCVPTPKPPPASATAEPRT
jgi:hypothetical protein